LWELNHGRSASVETLDMKAHVLGRVEEDPGISVQRIAAAEGVPLVWIILHEQYLTHTTSSKSTPDHCAGVVFCKWLLAKCIVNTQFATNSLLTDVSGSTRNSNMNFL
jgi:hypothetical protein